MSKMLSLGVVVLATAAFITTTHAAQSTFVSPSQSIAFGLSIPDDPNNEDIYFSLAFPLGEYWAAVGMGNNQMPGSLVFMIYASSSGENVTFSPRLATSNSEPEYYSGLDYETITNSTGLVNQTTYVYSAVCHNCRSWPNGGAIDVNSTAQEFIFATGPVGELMSNNKMESVKMHDEHGVFTMDMQHATGPAGPVALTSTTTNNNDGTTLVGKVTEDMRDWVALFHAVFMIAFMVCLLPFGTLILRFTKGAVWHGLNQTIAFLGALVGFGLGVKTSTLYNRSRHFNSAHQVIGLLVFAFMFVQFTLGFMHHRAFKKTQQKTKLGPIHVWLGRVIVIMSVVNGFLGFPLALSIEYDYALAGLILGILALVGLTLLIKRCIDKRVQRMVVGQAQAEGPLGYHAEPWLAPGQVYNNTGAFEMGPIRKSASTAVSESRAAPPAYS